MYPTNQKFYSGEVSIFIAYLWPWNPAPPCYLAVCFSYTIGNLAAPQQEDIDTKVVTFKSGSWCWTVDKPFSLFPQAHGGPQEECDVSSPELKTALTVTEWQLTREKMKKIYVRVDS